MHFQLSNVIKFAANACHRHTYTTIYRTNTKPKTLFIIPNSLDSIVLQRSLSIVISSFLILWMIELLIAKYKLCHYNHSSCQPVIG